MRGSIMTMVLVLVLVSMASAITIYVPEDYPTIGAAINAASDGDSILVGPGTYDPAPTVYGEPNNITLLGNGYSGPNRTTIVGNFSTEIEAKIDLRNTDGWEVGGFEMMSGHKGINTGGCSNSYFHDLYVHDVTWYYAVGVEIGDASNMLVERCVFERCTYSGIEVFYDGGTGIIIRNNTIVWTTGAFLAPGNGILIRGSVPDIVIENNIIAYNDDEGVEFMSGVYVGTETLDFNDVFGNSGNAWQGCLPGPDNISMDPLFAGGAGVEHYMLQAASPCIDAGDPGSPPDPDGTVADIGCFYFDQAFTPGNLSLDLEPVNPPIIIPIEGGSFEYTATITCDPTNYALFDAWVDFLLPNGVVMGPIFVRSSLFIQAGSTVIRELEMYVSAWAMPGIYEFRGYLGEYPDSVCTSDSFVFEKLATGGMGHEVQSAYAVLSGWGEPVRISLPAEASTARDEIQFGCSPNPFNPRTALEFEIPEAGFTRLTIYDLSGRRVATLLDRHLKAGTQSIRFDGSQLASGVYLAVLEAAGARTMQRLLLIK